MLPKSGSLSATTPKVDLPSGFVLDSSQIDGDNHAASVGAGVSIVVSKGATSPPLPVPDAPGSAPLSHSTPTLAVRRSAAPPAPQSINTEPQRIAEGVFIGEGRAKSGEKFFLKMERVTTANKQHWRNYALVTSRLTSEGRSLMASLIKTIKKAVAPDGTIGYTNENYDVMAPQLGMSKEEFQDLVNLLGKHGFISGKENRAKHSALLNISAGAGHIILDTTDECYVVYASKTENFQIPVAEFDHLAPPPPLKEYFRLYGDLLVCVGTNFSWKGGFHSKGIFRNPYSTIENTYKGVAMILRAFSGAVAKKYFPDKHTLFVEPLTSMQHQISSSLNPEDYSVKNYSHEQALQVSTEALLDGDNFPMPMNYIKVSALDRLYRNHASS